jgi:hypothetical protein
VIQKQSPDAIEQLASHEMRCECGANTTLAEILSKHRNQKACCPSGTAKRKLTLTQWAELEFAVTGRRGK